MHFIVLIVESTRLILSTSVQKCSDELSIIHMTYECIYTHTNTQFYQFEVQSSLTWFKLTY